MHLKENINVLLSLTGKCSLNEVNAYNRDLCNQIGVFYHSIESMLTNICIGIEVMRRTSLKQGMILSSAQYFFVTTMTSICLVKLNILYL